MTCLVGTHSIEATAAPPATGTTRHHLANRHLAGDRLRITPSLRIAPGHSRLQSSRLPTTDYSTTEWLLPWQDYQMGTYQPITSSYSIPHLATNRTMPQPFMYNSVHSVVHVRIDAKPLATKLYRCQYHESIITCTSNSVCVFIVLQYTPNY